MIRGYVSGDIARLGAIKEDDGFLGDADLEQQKYIAETIEQGGEILAVYGVVEMWDGVGQSFAMTAERYDNGLFYTKAAKKFINNVMHDFGFRRIQTYVKEDNESFIRWAQLVGFENEALMKNFAPDGGDMYLYVRTQ